MVVKIMLVFLFWNLSEEGDIGIEMRVRVDREWYVFELIDIILYKDGRRLYMEYIAR